MGILSWIAFGLIAGGVTRWMMPGKSPLGIFGTMLLGMGGAVIGGIVGSLLGFGGISGFDIRSLITAIGGATILLCGYQFAVTRGIARPRDI